MLAREEGPVSMVNWRSMGCWFGPTCFWSDALVCFNTLLVLTNRMRLAFAFR
jgi:hypothetical protein